MTTVNIDTMFFLPRTLEALRAKIPRMGIVAIKDLLRASPLIHAETARRLIRGNLRDENIYWLWTDRVHGQHVLEARVDIKNPDSWVLLDMHRVDEPIPAPRGDYMEVLP